MDAENPNSPVVKQPQIEPVVKIELWKEALSGFADFNAVAFPGAGDRIWDTDQNAGNAAFVGFNQSQADWVDMNNNGAIANGRPVSVSLVTNEWRLAETTLIVDDDPLNDGLGWSIGAEFFDVEDVEEIRAVMFVGEFGGQDLSNGGSFWVDNLMVEVFANEAAMLATPNPNTAPVEGIPGDFNNNGTVDAADYVILRNDSLGQAAYDTWGGEFRSTARSRRGLSGVANVPEPVSYGLMILAVGAFGMMRVRVRAIGSTATTGTNC